MYSEQENVSMLVVIIVLYIESNKGPIINYREEATKWWWVGGGGTSGFTPTEKRGGPQKVLAMLKGGTTGFGVVLAHVLGDLAMLKGRGGCTKSFHPLKEGDVKGFTLS